jgi:hypothetical protein
MDRDDPRFGARRRADVAPVPGLQSWPLFSPSAYALAKSNNEKSPLGTGDTVPCTRRRSASRPGSEAVSATTAGSRR